MDILRNEIGLRPHAHEISKILAGPSSRWGATQFLFLFWGLKSTHRL